MTARIYPFPQRQRGESYWDVLVMLGALAILLAFIYLLAQAAHILRGLL